MKMRPEISFVHQPYDGLPQPVPSDEELLVCAWFAAHHAQLV